MLRRKTVEKVPDVGHLDIVGGVWYNLCMVKRLFDEWGTLPPRWRFTIRTAVAALGGAIAGGFLAGDITDWATLKGALITTGLKLVMGLLTPEEPFVGLGKPVEVTVPEGTELVGDTLTPST